MFSRRGFLQISGVAAATTLTRPAHGTEPPAAAPTTTSVLCRVNGVEQALDVGDSEASVDTIRERLGLTGSKRGCGHGACGACTIHLDHAPVCSCLLPATSLDGRDVTTIEGIGTPDALHPVQRAFAAEDALQCGYCTPGFVMAAVAFYDQWRASRGVSEPPAEAVAAGLAGNLCRCGAYIAIIRAVQAACAGRYDGPEFVPARVDAVAKVTGTARYTTDIKVENQLEGMILRAPHAHARVSSLELARARTLPGVKAVVALIAVGGRVRYAGQEIAAVAATDAVSARAALAAIEVRYDVLPPAVGWAARAENAPVVYPDPKAEKPPPAAEGPIIAAKWSGNLRGPVATDYLTPDGKAKTAVAQARADGTATVGQFVTQVQCHTTLEPHCCVADWRQGADGPALTVYISSQSCADMVDDFATRWKVSEENVRVLCSYVGGGFGSKVGLQPHMIAAVDLSRAAGAPVRVVLDRAEDLIVGGYRPAHDMTVAIATDPNGAAQGITFRSDADVGCSAGATHGYLVRLMYPDVPKDIVDFDVLSHAAPAKPFRAPGGPQAFFALEQTVDMVAERLAIDPLRLRQQWDSNPHRLRLYAAAQQTSLWSARRKQADTGRYRRGVGVAAGCWFYFVSPRSRVQVDATPQGLVVASATQDIGSGTRTLLAHTVATVFGLPMTAIQVRVGDSFDVYGPTSAGSRTAVSVGPAAQVAAEKLRDELVELAAEAFGLTDARPAPGGVAHSSGMVAWADVFARCPTTSVTERRPRDSKPFALPFTVMDINLGKGFPGAVQLVEVEVDTWTGKTRVLQTWGGFAAGKPRYRPGVIAQIEGGILQGISYTLYEERRLDPTRGVQLTRGLEDYRIMGIGDIPEIQLHLDEEGFDHVPGGGIGVGEISTIATAGAIANAVYDAVGYRPTTLPIRPDRVIQGVRA